MAIEQTVTDRERASAIAALNNAKEDLERALYQLQNRQETVIPTLVRDFIKSTEGWCWHAREHLKAAQERYNKAGLPR